MEQRADKWREAVNAGMVAPGTTAVQFIGAQLIRCVTLIIQKRETYANLPVWGPLIDAEKLQRWITWHREMKIALGPAAAITESNARAKLATAAADGDD